ncbi:MAG: type II toxin-antitoxin system ParD family antitoxin [Spiribacter salinus]|uniref:Antitoxin ParD n=1 Tax=Spiribacter salinus TaxID=1335746 RepID=A0A540VNU7_9GAMM|nr:MAG: type II toxin-antitoxin system ParD family antitoxin [Spiribacter salinus]
MARMNVSLPEAMKRWVEQQVQSGRYSNKSEYVRELIQRDQERREKISRMQALVDEGLASGPGERSMAELRETGRQKISGD